MKIDLSFLFEIMLPVLAFSLPVVSDKKAWMRFAISLSLLCVITVLIQTNPLTGNLLVKLTQNILGAVLFFLLILLLFYLILLFSFHYDPIEALFILFLSYNVQHFSYCFRLFVEGITSGSVVNDQPVLYYCVHIITAVLSYLLFARSMAVNGSYKIKAVSSFVTAAGVFLVVLVLSVLASGRGFMFYHSIYAMVCCGYIMLSARALIAEQGIKEEMALKEEIWKKNKMQYELSRETIAVVNQNYHDMKHKLAAINRMSLEDDRRKALQKIEDSIAMYDTVVHSGNEILDTVLTEKRMICDNNHIPMSCICDGECLDFMEVIDLYTLMGNALDNAIEANMSVAEDKRYLSVRVRNVKGVIMIEITNPYANELMYENGDVITSKHDKQNHGYGLKSMQEIVSRYDGIMDYKAEDNVFNLKFVFQNNE